MKHMFSPWRSSYIESFASQEKRENGKSIFSDISSEDDERRFVLHRGQHCFIIMNLYPYNAGHLMVIPYLQTPSLSELNQETRLEAMNLIDLSIKALTNVCSPHGFNVGLNLGEVSGGSISEHLHFHIVPRWNGDTNFMPTIADVKVISVNMQELYTKLRDEFKRLTK